MIAISKQWLNRDDQPEEIDLRKSAITSAQDFRLELVDLNQTARLISLMLAKPAQHWNAFQQADSYLKDIVDILSPNYNEPFLFIDKDNTPPDFSFTELRSLIADLSCQHRVIAERVQQDLCGERSKQLLPLLHFAIFELRRGAYDLISTPIAGGEFTLFINSTSLRSVPRRIPKLIEDLKVKTLGELLDLPNEDLLEIADFGKTSLKQLQHLLAEYGLETEMTIPDKLMEPPIISTSSLRP